MSKWKQYEGFSKLSKKVGGPNNLIAIIAGAGALIGSGITTLIHKIIEKTKDNSLDCGNNYYVTTVDGFVNDEKEIKKETKFRVINRDDDAVIIQTPNDEDPIVARYDLLTKISNYK